MANLNEFKTLNEVELATVEGGDRNSYNAGRLVGNIIYNILHPRAPILYIPHH